MSNPTRRYCAAWMLYLLLAALAVPLSSAASIIKQSMQTEVGITPARGWSSWNTFRCDINETVIKEVVDAIFASGLRDAGYEYVNIDDCWMQQRVNGTLQPFQSKFPSGMKALADYIHSRGLKLGLYSDAGNKTCEGYPGSWGHEVHDARTFAEWGIDYLKYDYCGMDQKREEVEQAYMHMSVALAATQRPILFSMCSWGAGQPWEWAQGVANSWRVSPDLFAVWDREQAKALKLPGFLISVMEVVELMADKAGGARPGSFNDADMLVVGLDGMYPYGIVEECPPHLPSCKPGGYISREEWGLVGGLTLTQQRSHFSLWVMLSSPLILGNDPRYLRKGVLDILTAKEVLAIHADPLGRQATRIDNSESLQLWRKDLQHSDKFALLVLNKKSVSIDSTVLYFQDHFHDMHSKWGRELPANFTLQGPACRDEHDTCSDWALSGECNNNPGFMLWKCRKSCNACSDSNHMQGPQASALVRDAWAQEDLGLAVGKLTVAHLEPYEGRLFVFQFMDPTGLGAGAAAAAGGIAGLVAGVSGSAGYLKATSSVARRGATAAAAVAGADAAAAAVETVVTGVNISLSSTSSAASVVGAELQQKLADSETQATKLAVRVQQLTEKLANVQQQLQHAHQAAAAEATAAAALRQLIHAGPKHPHSGTHQATATAAAAAAAAAAAGKLGPDIAGKPLAGSDKTTVKVTSSSTATTSSSSSRIDTGFGPVAISADSRGLAQSLLVNVAVLVVGVVLGMVMHRLRGAGRHGRYSTNLGGFGYPKQQHSTKLY